MSDDRKGKFKDGRPRGRGAQKGGDELNRLPPPAFPPHQHIQPRRNHRRSAEDTETGGGVPDDAFISPDEPIVRSGLRIAKDAFISPDDPIVRSSLRFAQEALISPDEPLPPRDAEHVDTDEVVVTGIGDDPHLGPEELGPARHEDPIVADLALRVGRLADGLRDRGEATLRTTADMNSFETTLRAYCVGYLAAQRHRGGE